MNLTGTFYDVIIRLGYYEELIIEAVELVDLLTIIPVLDRMKFADSRGIKTVEIIIRKRVTEETDNAETAECQ